MNAIYLDPQKTSALEPPFVWDAHRMNGYGISPFAVPTGILVETSNKGNIKSLEFFYSDGGTRSQAGHLIDAAIRGARIFVAPSIERITTIVFDQPCGKSELAGFWGQLGALSSNQGIIPRRLNYAMISRILEAWASEITSEAEPKRRSREN